MKLLDCFGRMDVLIDDVAASPMAGRSVEPRGQLDSQVNYNLKSVFLTFKHVLPIMETTGRRCHRQTRSTSGLRWTARASRLRHDEGRRHPVLARRRRAICR